VVRWNAVVSGYGIADIVRGEWADDQPVFRLESVAIGVADALNQRKTVRRQRQWLEREDRSRDRK
jgi:hypothetical protein